MMGVCGAWGPQRMAWIRSKPSRSGITRSVITRSKGRAAWAARASVTPVALCTSKPTICSRSTRNWTFVLLSSTTRMRGRASRRPLGIPRSEDISTAISGAAASKGSVTLKVVPCPGVLSMEMVPPIMCTSSLTIASPRPAPSEVLFTCSKGTKAWLTCSALMPMPPSLTRTTSTGWG